MIPTKENLRNIGLGINGDCLFYANHLEDTDKLFMQFSFVNDISSIIPDFVILLSMANWQPSVFGLDWANSGNIGNAYNSSIIELLKKFYLLLGP